MTTQQNDPDVERDPDTEMLDALVTALGDALALIDQRPALPPGEQLAALAVAAVRGLMPILRDELDRRLA